MPWRFGWKHEYWDGHAHLTPRQHHVHVRVCIEARTPRVPTAAPHHLRIRAVGQADTPELVHAFIGSFQDGVEFCDWPVEKVREHARRNITDFFSGRRGTPLLAASRLAVDGRGPVGAALLGGREEGPTLDLLMVRPGSRRRRIGGRRAARERHHRRSPERILYRQRRERLLAPGVRLRGRAGPQPRAPAPGLLRPRGIALRSGRDSRTPPVLIRALGPAHHRARTDRRARRLRGGYAFVTLPLMILAPTTKSGAARSNPATIT